MSARCTEGVTAVFSYSSTYLVESSGEWAFLIDLESSVLEIGLSKTFGGRAEISLSVPFISYNGGFLDGFLDKYHGTFGLPDYGRGQRPKNDFLFEVRKGGKTLIKGQAGGLSVGDIRLGLKHAVLTGDPLASLYGFLELPTGGPEEGYGNGEPDAGLAVLFDKSLGPDLTVYVNAGAVSPGDIRAEEEIGTRDFLFGSISFGWAYSERTSFHLEGRAQGSPYGSTGVREVDAASLALDLGLRHLTEGGSALEVSFSEDLNTAGAPDFTASLAYGFAF